MAARRSGFHLAAAGLHPICHHSATAVKKIKKFFRDKGRAIKIMRIPFTRNFLESEHDRFILTRLTVFHVQETPLTTRVGSKPYRSNQQASVCPAIPAPFMMIFMAPSRGSDPSSNSRRTAGCAGRPVRAHRLKRRRTRGRRARGQTPRRGPQRRPVLPEAQSRNPRHWRFFCPAA